MGRRIMLLAFLCLTLALGLLFPTVFEQALRKEESLPPGISDPQRQLLRVWVVEDPLGASPWLKRQAARMEQAHEGLSVYLRTARPGELSQEGTVLPDLILFGPGSIQAPERLFLPLAELPSVSEGALRAGRFQGMQYAVPVCLDGYALAYDPAACGATAATPAPTPLLGIGAQPMSTPAPERKTTFEALTAAILKVPRPKGAACDFVCAPGMQLMLFTDLLGDMGSLPAGIMMQDFSAVTPQSAAADFLSGRCRAALLTTRQLRALAAQGKAFGLLAADLPATDLFLTAGIVPGEGQTLALSFLLQLLSEDGQKDLAASGLLAVIPDMRLYGTDPAFGPVEESLKGGPVLPNVFTFDPKVLKDFSLSAFRNRGSPLEILRSLE